MKYLSINKLLFIVTLALFTSCEEQLSIPVADFSILDGSAIDEVDPENIKTGEQITFENTGTGEHLVVWTGDPGAVYSEEPELLELDSTNKSYTDPYGEVFEYIQLEVGRYVNRGSIVDTKTGRYTYSYTDAGLTGDTTYIVTWIATNVDVNGNSESAIKQVTVRVRAE